MKIILSFLLAVLIAGPVLAETITFKDGRKLTGSITQQDLKKIVMDVKGIPMTIFLDEIKDIDGIAVALPDSPKPGEQAKSTLVLNSNVTADKRALILKFIDVFGTRKAMEQNFNTMQNDLLIQNPQMAQKLRERFKIEDVIERLIPLYDKYFTSEELKAYIDFYSSEKGQKLISSIGLIMQDSVNVTMGYMKEKFPEVQSK
jgi:hypothetical protein